MDGSTYTENYKEEQTIGRGNFGSAHLVISKKDNKKYVAKKVQLAGLGEKEQQSAKQEVNPFYLAFLTKGSSNGMCFPL